MNPVLLAVILVSAVGLVLGLVLALFSAFFAVPVNETEQKVRECLPGANCGACGFSGCDGYSAALANGETNDTGLCLPGGNDVAAEIAGIMGVEAGEIQAQAAFVMCGGDCEHCGTKLNYAGAKSCRMAAQLFGGPKNCNYGCLGFGDCLAECEYGAISMTDGIAKIDSTLCRACKKCTRACPHGLIQMLPVNVAKATVRCANHDKGAFTRKECTAGCIGCMKCVKACPNGAIKINSFCAEVDPAKCTGCGQCIEGCPTHSITLQVLPQ